MDNDCIFCKIIEKQIPSNIVYEDEMCLAFDDINPKAKVHFLVIPKQHIKSVNEVDETNKDVVSHIFSVIPKIAETKGIKEDGYRVVSNIGKFGGQEVEHLHFHVLGGQCLKDII